MTFYEHIRELRAELSASTSAKEIRQIKRELQAALAQMTRVEGGLDAVVAPS